MEYKLYELMLFFVIYSVLGWAVEQGLYGITGKLVKRGFLKFPACPIYGFGAVLILLVVSPLKGNLVYALCTSLLICVFLEFVVVIMIKLLSGAFLWGYYFTFPLIGSLFAIVAIVHTNHLVESLIYIMPIWLKFVVLIVFFVAVLSDFIDQVAMLLSYRKEMKEIRSLDINSAEYGKETADFLDKYARWIKAYPHFRRATQEKLFQGHSIEEIQIIKSAIKDHLK